MKSYCSFSIRLNGLKKYIRDHQILVVYFFQNFHFNWFFFLSSLRSLSSLVSLLSVLSLSLRFLLKHGTAWASVCGWKRRRCGGWLGLRSQHETGLGFGLRLETPAWWWWLGLAISAWWWLGLADLGVVVAWACRSRRGGGLGLPILRISAWARTTTAWLSSQICNHRGHTVKHGPPRREARTTLLCRSQRSGGGGAFRSSRWFLVVQISGGFWFGLHGS